MSAPQPPQPPQPPRPRGPSQAVTRPVSPAPRATPTRLLGALVAVARVLAGGLVVLAVVVLAAPLALGGPGPGADTVVAHVVAAVVAVGATALAAHRRTPSPVALGAALLVPVTLVLLLGVVWWS